MKWQGMWEILKEMAGFLIMILSIMAIYAAFATVMMDYWFNNFSP